MQALRTLLGEGDMLAYLAMMAPRLVELRRVLGPMGSVYLHCDPTARHYLSEDVRRGGNERSHPGVHRNAGSIGAVRPTQTQSSSPGGSRAWWTLVH
jgi:hypothetical protein